MSAYIACDNRCVICGAIIPEGRMVCWICEAEIMQDMQQYSAKDEPRQSAKAHQL